jgi:hypothetical protein
MWSYFPWQAIPQRVQLAVTVLNSAPMPPRKSPEKPAPSVLKPSTASAKRQKLPVAYTHDGKPVCPRCFSTPSVRLRVDRALAGRRGSTVRVSDERIEVNGQPIRVLRTLYPCANPECRTDLIMHTAPSASITDDRLAGFRLQHALTPSQLADYATGSHDGDGVWRQASLF